MYVVTDPAAIDTVLERGVIAEILPDKNAFRDRLLSGERLRFYLGADPSGASLHLGHAVNYMLLEDFRLLGHEVIVLFGDFTAQIGDPTGRDTARTQLSKVEVIANQQQWLEQLQLLLDFNDQDNPPRVLYNADWLRNLNFEDVINLAAHFTVQQMLERDMFARRMDANHPIYLHEFLYPLMQGYDSVAMEVDVEVCGTDQTFNAMAGRTLNKRYNNQDKHVVTVNLLVNPDTGEKMAKSTGSGVFLSSSAEDMYGAIMAQPDAMTKSLLLNVTRLDPEQIEGIMQLPARDAKAQSAFEVVARLHGRVAAEKAHEAFERQFRHGQLPKDIPEYQFSRSSWKVEDLLTDTGLVASKSEARRLREQNGVKRNSETVHEATIKVADGDVIQVGKRKFVRLRQQADAD